MAELGSAVSDTTLASFVSVPGACGVTLISTLALASSAIVPSAQSTVPAFSEQVPCVGVAESNVTPAGSMSLRLTPVASWGPELWTVSE